MDFEAIGLPQPRTAILDNPGERPGRLPTKDRQRSPAIGKPSHGHIHRDCLSELNHPKLRTHLEANQFFRGDRRSVCWILKLRDVVGAKRIQADPPGPGPHLRPQLPRLVDRDGNRPIHRGKLPAHREHLADDLFAAAARHAQLDLGPQPDRPAILEHPCHMHRPLVLLFFSRPASLQPKPSAGVTFRQGDRRFVADQAHDANRFWDREPLRQPAPAEGPRNLMPSRIDLNRRYAIACHDRRGLTVEGDRHRPGLRIPRQRQPGRAKRFEFQRPAAAIGRHRQLKRRRPDGNPLAGVIVGRRTAQVGHVGEHPVSPGCQGRRQIVLVR